MIDNEKLNLILASNSKGRKALLTGANINFLAIAANIDEDIIKNRNHSLGFSPKQTAQDLADEKAIFVSLQNQTALVLGSDQVCHLDNEILNKPGNKQRLFNHIKKLTGETHILTSAFSIALNGKIIFRHSDDALLTMYELGDEDINTYIAKASDDVVNSAGGYHLEAVGVQLFKKIEGSYFTILGLPLLPLIAFLNDYQTK
ncbi:MAG: Maf-like protein [Rhizobiales bacterium]|nr:Maf-like protein [Hyphomicrobiales bacterium]